VLLVLLAVAQWKSSDILDWTVGWWESTLVSLTEDGLNEAQRTRVSGAFDSLRTALAEGSVDWETASEVNRTWTNILGSTQGKPLTWEQILPLIERLEALSDGARRPSSTPPSETKPPGALA
jgi:hypothetical protein